MMTSSEPLKLFYCYAHEDKKLRDELDTHLSLMKRQGLVTVWYDHEIRAGTNWEHEIDTHLTNAHIILLLVSAPFLASDYCYGIEMQKALQRDEVGTARVVPILLRPVDWKGALFSHLQILPAEAKPVTRWTDRDDAFEYIAIKLREVVEELRIFLETEKILKEGFVLNALKQYKEIFVALKKGVTLPSWYAKAYSNKGNTLYSFKRYEEALVAYEQAIRIDPNYTNAYTGKGVVLNNLRRYEEALSSINQAIELDPNYSQAYTDKNIMHNMLNRRLRSLIVPTIPDFEEPVTPEFAYELAMREMEMQEMDDEDQI